MSAALKRNRRFINGIDDWQYQKEKAPVQTSGDQFILGQKSFHDGLTCFANITCHGKYIGDGSLLTNVLGTDVTKLPLAGGTMSGNILFSDVDPNITASLSNSLLSMSNTGSDSYGKFGRTYLQFEEGNGDMNTQSAHQIQLESGSGNTLLLNTQGMTLNLNQSISSLLTQSGLTFINETTDIHSAYFDSSAALVNGSNTNISTALNQILNDGNGNSNEITNQSVFIKEDGGGKDATYGLISSRHRNENTYDSCVTQVGINPDGYVGFTVQAGIATEVSEVFMGYKSTSAQPELTVSDNRFIKWNTGTSLRIRQQDGNRIEKWDAVQVNNGNYGQFDFHVYDKYLDGNGEGGWTVTLINPGNLPDPQVTSPDIYFVSSQFGVNNSFTLLKWTAARIILTPTTPGIYPYDFVWLVSM